MTARERWKQIQAILNTAQDGHPGQNDDSAIEKLEQEALAEIEAERSIDKEIGFMDGSPIIQNGNVISFRAGMNINADGSPHAYHPNGAPPGLDYLANAGYPGDWWGIATDINGNPFVQHIADPAPGFYVSTTALQDTAYPTRDPKRYVDSEKVPFIVLPSNFPVNIKLGTKCSVTFNGKKVDAIYADIGPRFQLGEGSIALAKELGINPDPKRGGTEEKMLYEVYL